MSDLVTVDNLIKGGENINRWRKEVDNIVKMLVGMLDFNTAAFNMQKAGARNVGNLRLDMRFSTCEWRFSFFSDDLRKRLDIECWLLSEAEYGRRESFGYKFGGDFPTSQVLVVREALQFFVESMLRVFPELQERVKPLIEAAV